MRVCKRAVVELAVFVSVRKCDSSHRSCSCGRLAGEVGQGGRNVEDSRGVVDEYGDNLRFAGSGNRGVCVRGWIIGKWEGGSRKHSGGKERSENERRSGSREGGEREKDMRGDWTDMMARAWVSGGKVASQSPKKACRRRRPRHPPFPGSSLICLLALMSRFICFCMSS